MKLLLRRAKRKTINDIARGGVLVKADPTLTVVATVPVAEETVAGKENDKEKETRKVNTGCGRVVRKKRVRVVKKSKRKKKTLGREGEEQPTTNAAVVQELAKDDTATNEKDAKEEPTTAQDQDDQKEKGDDVETSVPQTPADTGKDIAENISGESGNVIRTKRANKKSKKKKKKKVLKQDGEENRLDVAALQEGDNQDATNKEKDTEKKPPTTQDEEKKETKERSVQNSKSSKSFATNKSAKPDPIDTSADAVALSSAASPSNSLASPKSTKSANTIKVDNRKKKSKSQRKNVADSRSAPSPVPEEDESIWSDNEDEHDDEEEPDPTREDNAMAQRSSQQSGWNILTNFMHPQEKAVNDNVDVVVDTDTPANADGGWGGFLSNLWNADDTVIDEDDATLENTVDGGATYDNTVEETSTYDNTVDESTLGESIFTDGNSYYTGTYSQSCATSDSGTTNSSTLYTGSATTNSTEGRSFGSASFSQSGTEASSHAGTLESDMSPRVYKEKHAGKKHRSQAKNPQSSINQKGRPPRAPSGMKKMKAGLIKAVKRSKTESPIADINQGRAATSSPHEMGVSTSSSSQNDTKKERMRSNSPQVALKKVRSNSPQFALKKVRSVSPQIDINIKSAARTRSPVQMKKIRSLSIIPGTRAVHSKVDKISAGDDSLVAEPDSLESKEPVSVGGKETDAVEEKQSDTEEKKETDAVEEKETDAVENVELDAVEKHEPDLVDKNTTPKASRRGSVGKASAGKSSVSKYSGKFSVTRSVRSSPLLGFDKKSRTVSPAIFDRMLALKAARTNSPEVPASGTPAPRIVPHQPDDVDDANSQSPTCDAEVSKDETKQHQIKTKCTVLEGSGSVELSVCDEGREEEPTLPILPVCEEDREEDCEEGPSLPLIMATESEQRDDPPLDDISVETNELMKEAQAMLA